MQASKLKFPPAKYFEKFIVQLKRDPAEPVYFNLSRARESSNFSTVNSLSLSLSLPEISPPRKKVISVNRDYAVRNERARYTRVWLMAVISGMFEISNVSDETSFVESRRRFLTGRRFAKRHTAISVSNRDLITRNTDTNRTWRAIWRQGSQNRIKKSLIRERAEIAKRDSNDTQQSGTLMETLVSEILARWSFRFEDFFFFHRWRKWRAHEQMQVLLIITSFYFGDSSV